MEESSLQNHHDQDPYPTSSYSSFSIFTKPLKSKTLLKYLIIISVLIVFSYFSSQVPDFFDKNPILTNLWDLIYLLLIGIVVCYGLFTTKIDSNYYNDTNIDGIETFISGISHISSIFEDNQYEFEENDLNEIGNGFGKYDGKKVNPYVLGESLVVISDKKYVLEQLGKPTTIKQNNSLGLPVRNLGLYSAARKSDIKDSSSGLVSDKLEDKFKETMVSDKFKETTNINSPTPFIWRSKSMRLANETSQFGSDVYNLKSRSMKSSVSSQMKNYSEIEESKVLETNHDMNSETSYQNVQFMKSKSQRSVISSSPQINNRPSFKDVETPKVDDSTLGLNSNATFLKSRSQRSSAGASSEGLNKNATFLKSRSQGAGASSKMNVEAFDYVLGKEEKADSSNSIVKPAQITTTYKRGKSVRTNRLKEQVPCPTDDKVEMTSKFETTTINVLADELSDTESHPSEVDRKADEFIAKFKEQIRLQKIASARNLNHW